MERTYKWTLQGTSSNGQIWSTHGTVTCEWHETFDKIGRDNFDQITQGRAVYGYPGLSCNGPYKITNMTIDIMEN